MDRISALIIIIFGMAMALTSLLLPPQGEIDSSVLMMFAQVLIYAGSIFGVKIYIDQSLTNSNKNTDERAEERTMAQGAQGSACHTHGTDVGA